MTWKGYQKLAWYKIELKDFQVDVTAKGGEFKVHSD